MKSAEGKFKILNDNNIRYVQGMSHYEHFLNLASLEKYKLIVMPEERDSGFVAYWQGQNKLIEDSQQIYLQIGDKVMEYKLPLKGRVKLRELERSKINEFTFENHTKKL